jgi:LAS superfamily LD-carboxypeptidase LdcB
MRLSVAILGPVLLLALAGCISAPHRVADAQTCADPAAFAAAAAYNRAAETNLAFAPFGRPEAGWAVYAAQIAREIGSACPTGSPGFAAAVARWQAKAALAAHGALDGVTFEAMKVVWQQRRPFVRVRADAACPRAASPDELVLLPPGAAWRGAEVRLRPAAMSAFEAMIGAARREVPEVATDPELLTAFSGYRSPDYDAARCAAEHNCNGVVRAACSAHRTGLAVDLALGAAPGFTVDSSADANRLYQSRTAAYRWLVANASRFGFVNYAFEPWHWEWTGEAP